jgi:hypothetical protein
VAAAADFSFAAGDFKALGTFFCNVVRKWRRNGLKRLNSRPEMVWSRKPRTHNIWYAAARPTVRRFG